MRNAYLLGRFSRPRSGFCVLQDSESLECGDCWHKSPRRANFPDSDDIRGKPRASKHGHNGHFPSSNRIYLSIRDGNRINLLRLGESPGAPTTASAPLFRIFLHAQSIQRFRQPQHFGLSEDANHRYRITVLTV